MKKLLVLALLLAAPAARAESPRWGSFHFRLGSYRPNIDSEFKGKAGCAGGADCTPYQDLFGTSGAMMYQVEFARSLFTGYGSLDLGLGVGWTSKTAKGFVQGSSPPVRSGDDTSLRILPLTLSLTYRFDMYAGRFPLVPFARVALERYQWWATGGGGSTSAGLPGQGSGSGATNGWSGALGLAFLLDFIDPTLAREMDRDIGINNTYLFLQAGKAEVKDFGSKKSWDLSPDKSVTWSGGLLFAF